MKSRTLIVAVLGAIIGLGAASHPTTASTQSWYFHGSALCYMAENSNGTMVGTGYYYANTHVTETADVRCPAMPNTSSSVNYDDDFQIRAYVWDRHQTLAVQCRVNVYDRDDSSVEYSSYESTSGYNNSAAMYMAVDFPTTSQTSITGHAELYCLVPDSYSGSSSGIGEYRLYDNGPG